MCLQISCHHWHLFCVVCSSQDDRIGKDVGLLMSEDSNVYPTKQELPACNITSFQYSYNQYCMKRVLCGEIRGSVSDQGIKLESWKYRQMLEPGCITICLVPKQESHLHILLVSKHFSTSFNFYPSYCLQKLVWATHLFLCNCLYVYLL